MSVIPAQVEIAQIDRATFDFELQFFTDDAGTVPLDLTSKDVRCELWDERRKNLKGMFAVTISGADNNVAYFRLEPAVEPELLKGQLWLDVLFVETDSSPEGFRRDYYVQMAVDFGKGFTT
jgi:hypothetical protein